MQAELLTTLEKVWDDYDVFVVTAPTGCHAPGQGILMYDGSIKKVEDIVIGDQVMGPDSEPRTVHTLYYGEDEMYRITPRRGDSWVVNSGHILNVNQYYRDQRGGVRSSTTRNLNISVKDFMEKSDNFRSTCTQWKPDIVHWNVPTNPLPIEPYILGLWLGDGSSAGPSLTTMDDDIGMLWIEYGEQVMGLTPRVEHQEGNRACTINLRVDRGQKNPMTGALRDLEVLGNKHIPDSYLYSTPDERRALLAGLIDTDGYCNNQKNSIEIIQKNERLARQILFLCRSLGYSANISEKIVRGESYWRVLFSGVDVDQIPVRCSRKNQPSNSSARMTNSRFTIESIGRGEYYGFGVDGDNLYLLEDFTVTHNSGKTAISKCILDWTGSATYIAPTNQLIDQFLEEFPDTPTLHAVDRYQCIDYEWRSCGETKRKEGGFCKGCQCSKDISRARFGSKSGIYNYHIYLSRRNELYRSTLVVDEAHNLIPLIQSLNEEKIWQHQAKYPNSVVPEKSHTVAEWIDSLSAGRRRGKKISKLYRAMTSDAPEHIVERTLIPYGRRDRVTGKQEERDCILMTPIDIRDAKPILWPRGKVEKIVLLSATISEVDIRDLGLDRRRVCYLDCASPIPAESRPVYVNPVATVSHGNAEQATSVIARHIRDDILPEYSDVKGIIHSTYEQSQLLRKYLGGDPRVVFHTASNKMQIYRKFRESGDPLVLVACGMQEGVDLPYDAGRFQVVAKIPWPSLGDGAIRYRSEADPIWYTWNTLRDVIQACGRICRTPTDWGDTIILDGSVTRLLHDATEYGIIPKWYSEALTYVGGVDVSKGVGNA